jgi:hypothetical protein
MLTRQHSGVKVADSIPGPCRQDRRDRRDMHRRVGATARAGEGADPNDARPAEDVVRHRRRHARLPRGRGARAGGGLGQARQAIVNFGVLSRRSGLRRRRVCRSWRVSSSSLAPGAAPPLRSHARFSPCPMPCACVACGHGFSLCARSKHAGTLGCTARPPKARRGAGCPLVVPQQVVASSSGPWCALLRP